MDVLMVAIPVSILVCCVADFIYRTVKRKHKLEREHEREKIELEHEKIELLKEIAKNTLH